MCYAVYGYQHGELYLPGKGSSDGTTFTGVTLNLIITSMVLGSLSLFVVVLDHYDKRNNEHKYKFVNRIFMGGGILLIVIAFIMEFNNSITYQVVG